MAGEPSAEKKNWARESLLSAVAHSAPPANVATRLRFGFVLAPTALIVLTCLGLSAGVAAASGVNLRSLAGDVVDSLVEPLLLAAPPPISAEGPQGLIGLDSEEGAAGDDPAGDERATLQSNEGGVDGDGTTLSDAPGDGASDNTNLPVEGGPFDETNRPGNTPLADKPPDDNPTADNPQHGGNQGGSHGGPSDEIGPPPGAPSPGGPPDGNGHDGSGGSGNHGDNDQPDGNNSNGDGSSTGGPVGSNGNPSNVANGGPDGSNGNPSNGPVGGPNVPNGDASNGSNGGGPISSNGDPSNGSNGVGPDSSNGNPYDPSGGGSSDQCGGGPSASNPGGKVGPK